MRCTRQLRAWVGLLILMVLLTACQQPSAPTSSGPTAEALQTRAADTPTATATLQSRATATATNPAVTPQPATKPVATEAPTAAPAPSTPAASPQKTISDVTLQTEDDVTLAGTYYQPAAADAPGMVLLHMLGRKRGDWDAFARKLQDAGYGVIAIDLRGHGDSSGQRDWASMTRDAAAAAAFLRSRPEIDPAHVVVMGASIGANIAINYAAQDPQVAGVALLSPGLDYRGVKTAEAVKAYGERPLFIAASSEDEYAAASSRKLDSLARGPHQLLILDKQGHGTQMLGRDNGLESAIFQWLAEVTAK